LVDLLTPFSRAIPVQNGDSPWYELSKVDDGAVKRSSHRLPSHTIFDESI